MHDSRLMSRLKFKRKAEMKMKIKMNLIVNSNMEKIVKVKYEAL